MSKARRIMTVLFALVAIFGALSLIFMPDIAFAALAFGIGITLVYYGVRYILYYLTHAQHMVGGKWFLLIGLIMFDMGVFAVAVYDKAQMITLIYIISANLIAAVLGLIRTIGDKKDNNPAWKIHLAQCIAGFTQVILCVIFIRSTTIPICLYCIYTIYTCVLVIISAFKKTAIVYVQ